MLKSKVERLNQGKIKPLASYPVGLREGSRVGLAAQGRGFDSPQVHHARLGSSTGESTRLLTALCGIVPRPSRHISAPPIAGNYRQGSSSGRSRKDGVSRPAVILAHWPEESKSQNDLPQLPDRMPQVWKDPQGPATVPLLSVPEDIF